MGAKDPLQSAWQPGPGSLQTLRENKRFPKLNPNKADAFCRPDKKHKRAKLNEVVVDFMVFQRIGLLARECKSVVNRVHLSIFDTIVGYSIETNQSQTFEEWMEKGLEGRKIGK